MPLMVAVDPMLAHEQRQLIRKETIANTLATAVIAALLTWLIFHGREAIPVFDAPPYGLFGILPGTFNFTLLVTLALTLITRARVRRGQVSRIEGAQAPSLIAALPGNVLLRALTLALSAVLFLAALTFALVWLVIHAGLLPPRWSFAGIMALFVLHFVVLSLLVTPVVVWRALQDR